VADLKRLLKRLAASVGLRRARLRDDEPVIALVGNPNVGKSVLFNRLTSSYAIVSNYPGTTVEVAQGAAHIGPRTFRVIDTPGIYSLQPNTEEERVTRRILFERDPACIVHVLDTKNIERSLALTLELIETGKPLVVVLNMMDEALRLNIRIQTTQLATRLGPPVVSTIGITGRGISRLAKTIDRTISENKAPTPRLRYEPAVEAARDRIAGMLADTYAVPREQLALLLLAGDGETARLIQRVECPRRLRLYLDAVEQAERDFGRRMDEAIAMARYREVGRLVAACARFPQRRGDTAFERLDRILLSPLAGLPIFFAVVYFGLYYVVGVFGAGVLVDWLHNKLFQARLIPWVDGHLLSALPGDGWQHWARELIGGDYGIVSLGISYAVAIVLPIVGLFFLVFSILEDSGYLPRLAMLIDRFMKKIGLNGRAIIPMILGFGCGSMAVLTTRILETRRERIIATLLLALAIPCSAQYGLITGLLAQRPGGILGISHAFLLWATVIGVVFACVGLAAARILPGTQASFTIELPPMRVPRLGNTLGKTWNRVTWYFLEVLPLFIIASVIIWLGRLTRLFDLAIWVLQWPVRLLGLPAQCAEAILFGFFRRDFGAAGLYRLANEGVLDGRQLLVAATTLTLFLPCIAQLLIMKKEHGVKVSGLIALFVLTVAFLVGATLNIALHLTGAQL